MEVALAMKRLKHWTSFYTLNPVLPAAFLRALARQAGIHIYQDADDVLYASRNYLTVAAGVAGRRIIRLPGPCDVFDPFSGARIRRRVSRFEQDFQAKEIVI